MRHWLLMENFIRITLSQANCYLLKGEQGYLMIDCGNGRDQGYLLKKLQKLGISLSSIRWLLLTHHHSDHCGLKSFLISENSAMKIIMSEKCFEYLEAGRHFHFSSERYASKTLGYAFKLYGLFEKNPAETFPPFFKRKGDIILQGEESLLPESVGVSGRLLQTPGHTEDSISLIAGEDAFVGDAARNILGFLGAAREPILLYNREACLKSWDKLISLGVRYIHPGHGASFDTHKLIKNES